MGRIARSFDLFKRSYAVLMKDKELFVLPLVSGTLILGICATFFWRMGIFEEGAAETTDSKYYLPLFLMYVVTYTVAFFFQAALVAAALERMEGGDPTLGSALRAARKRFLPLLMWGVVAATVGMVLGQIQEKSKVAGKIVAGILGAAWSLATFFMVPVLVMERRGIGDSFKFSWSLFKKTWGETVVGNLGFGIVILLALIPVFLGAGLLFAANQVVAAVIVGVVGLAAVMVFFSALQGVYVASLYRYATTGEVAEGFDRALVDSAFRQK